jgi:hypothetical protein
VQLSALLPELNVPAEQPAQLRSVVALPGSSTWLPAMQLVH